MPQEHVPFSPTVPLVFANGRAQASTDTSASYCREQAQEHPQPAWVARTRVKQCMETLEVTVGPCRASDVLQGGADVEIHRTVDSRKLVDCRGRRSIRIAVHSNRVWQQQLQHSLSDLCAPTRTSAKVLSLQTPCALSAGKSTVKLEPSWKLPPCWLAFPEPECALQALQKNRKHAQLSSGPYVLLTDLLSHMPPEQ